MSKPRSYRLDDVTVSKLDKIQRHLQERLDHVAETTLTKRQKASSAAAIEFAVNIAFEKLSEQYDLD